MAKRNKIVDAVMSTINHYEYIGTPDEKVSMTFKYLVEMKKYIKELEQEIENKEYKCQQLEMKVSNLLRNQLEKLDNTIKHLI